MPKMKLTELKAMLASEKADALAAMASSKLSSERADALDYYLGNMTKDMPAGEGRSRAVSTDVADTVEGLMPQLMDIFCSGDDVIRFEPQGPEDVAAAEQETDYVNHVFMQTNPGFLVLYSFIKDALLSKVGVVKVWWEERAVEERETYYDLPDDQFAIIVADPDVEIVEHTVHGAQEEQEAGQPQEAQEPMEAPHQTTHDVVVKRSKTYANVKIDPVPPEEFGIARNARSIRECDYAFHKVLTTPAKLIAQGFDATQVNQLPPYTGITNVEEVNRDTVWEFQANAGAGGDHLNKAVQRVEVTEHYVRMDYEGDGNPRLYKVTTGGSIGDVLTKDGKPDIEPLDAIPFAAMTPVIMTHRFFGRSIADLVMDIQRIKTALLRGALDNTYLISNPRVEVGEEGATAQTLDDLLVARPGGVIRTKRVGSIEWQTVPNITPAIFPALEYMDQTREWRTGMSRTGQGIDANSLQNQSATAVNQVFNASQARVKLIARIFAETGIRDLFQLVHGMVRKHGQEAQTVRLRNNWVTVDPRNWKTRNDMTINVGLGVGSRSERLAHLMSVIGAQKELVAAGKVNMVGDQQLYNSAKELTKIVDLKNTDAFFNDPSKSGPAPQAPPDPKLMELQAKMQLEDKQAQNDIATQNAKVQSEMALAQQKFEFDKQIRLLDAEMRTREHHMTMVTKALTPPKSAGDGNTEAAPQAPDHSAIIATMMDHLKQASGPKRVVRDAQGRVSHVEPMLPFNG